MRPRVAKTGTIHIQQSMFSTDERDEMRLPREKLSLRQRDTPSPSVRYTTQF